MKKNHGFSVIGAIVIVLIVAALGFLTYQIIYNKNHAVQFDNYTSSVIIEASEDNGNIAEHVKGDPSAPAIIVEYSNYQCNHCASMTPIIDQLVAEYDGQFAVISRNATNSAFQNSKAAAAAAEAAGLQGYWEPYSKLLFENQAEWAYATGSERTSLFDKYFTEASNGQGNLEQFNADIASDAVEKKIKFDDGLARKDKITGTPNFFIDGQFLDSDGGELTLNGQTITYDSYVTTEDFTNFLKRIIAIKNGQPDPGQSPSTLNTSTDLNSSSSE